ncbi:hypothetical protein PC9H_009935 [Pleurotus ostreatus]|uniref:Uncharacterized protein n=1 Tax=Pleurotus ostreatus TaxID=5322 RepID=A0A8H6ZQN1_PLEOS|nr:uncharacterized protein PC9H_009935 [Pleurotus ostreatus]KAF7424627.1 hypothetical protein PC9H_009935 [Pleurotus ostreatus]
MFYLLPLILALRVSAATFTVFDVALPSDVLPAVGQQTASIVSFKPLGVGPDGTTYEIAQAGPTGGPIIQQTIVADKSGISGVANPQAGVEIKAACQWGDSQEGVCDVDISNESTTASVTYTGTLVPLFTVTVDDSSAPALPTSTSDAAPSLPSPTSAGGADRSSPAGSAASESGASASPTSDGASASPSASNAASPTLIEHICISLPLHADVVD